MQERLLWKVEEAARLLGLSRAKTYELVLAGVIPSVLIGRSRRVSAAALEAWVEQRAREPGDGRGSVVTSAAPTQERRSGM